MLETQLSLQVRDDQEVTGELARRDFLPLGLGVAEGIGGRRRGTGEDWIIDVFVIA